MGPGSGSVTSPAGTNRRTINHQRPFHSLEEYLVKVNPRQKELINLIQVGALDGLGTNPWSDAQI